MNCEFALDEFQGPLDLLLHLIKEKEMDLQTIELSVIADQYLQYIHQMDSSYLESMSEYLVIAAQLIEMKSKMLLPKEKVEFDDQYEEDPRDQLIKRLIEYKKYKDVVEELRDFYDERQTIHTKLPASMDHYVVDTTEMIPDNLEVYDLIKAMQKMLQRKALSMPLESKIARVEISVEERTDQIRSFFKVHKGQRVLLDDLFEDMSKTYIVITFFSVLVLVKAKEIEIEQNNNFEDIYLREV